MAEKAYRSEVSQAIQSQVKPLHLALNATAEQVHAQEASLSRQENYLREKLSYLERQLEELASRRAASGFTAMEMNQLEERVESVLREKRSGGVDQLSVDLALSRNNEYILQQLSSLAGTLRMEVDADTRQEFARMKRAVDEQLAEMGKVAREARCFTPLTHSLLYFFLAFFLALYLPFFLYFSFVFSLLPLIFLLSFISSFLLSLTLMP